MRKFKFRVYDTLKKKFITNHESNGGLIGILLDGTIDYKYSFYHENCDHLVIQQYTGINDKNGKEIYEGDFVKYGNRTYSVEFNAENYGCVHGWNLMKDGEAAHYYYGQSPDSDHEVVGNIFEGIYGSNR